MFTENFFYHKMKKKTYYTAGTILKSNRKIAERGKIYTPNREPLFQDDIYLQSLHGLSFVKL
jgi:hypothetical protein